MYKKEKKGEMASERWHIGKRLPNRSRNVLDYLRELEKVNVEMLERLTQSNETIKKKVEEAFEDTSLKKAIFLFVAFWNRLQETEEQYNLTFERIEDAEWF